jgi:hypothetical protein
MDFISYKVTQVNKAKKMRFIIKIHLSQNTKIAYISLTYQKQRWRRWKFMGEA